jgi:hypothetical protein
MEEEEGVECLAGGGGTKLTIVPGLTSQFLGSPSSRMFLNKRNLTIFDLLDTPRKTCVAAAFA